jgi:hypothetical protein
MVKLSEKYYVDVDGNNLILRESTGKVRKKTGEPVYSTIGYYTTWDAVLSKIFTLLVCEKINKQALTTVEELKVIFIESKQEVKQLLSPSL